MKRKSDGMIDYEYYYISNVDKEFKLNINDIELLIYGFLRKNCDQNLYYIVEYIKDYFNFYWSNVTNFDEYIGETIGFKMNRDRIIEAQILRTKKNRIFVYFERRQIIDKYTNKMVNFDWIPVPNSRLCMKPEQ